MPLFFFFHFGGGNFTGFCLSFGCDSIVNAKKYEPKLQANGDFTQQ